MSHLRTPLGTSALTLALVTGTTISVIGAGGASAEPHAAAAASSGAASDLAAGEGAAFAMSNATTDNRIISYRRSASGRLTKAGSVSTRGQGHRRRPRPRHAGSAAAQPGPPFPLGRQRRV